MTRGGPRPISTAWGSSLPPSVREADNSMTHQTLLQRSPSVWPHSSELGCPGVTS